VLPDAIPFDQGAVMMCSSATSLHALRQARLRPGDSIAVFGLGGLGISAIQIAAAFGAHPVFAVDIQPLKLELARSFGAVPVNADFSDPVGQILGLTSGRGVDVALELIGLPLTMRQAVRSVAIRGRAALAGITNQMLSIAPYSELLNKEAEIIGVSDHLAQELPLLMDLVARGKLDLARAVTRTIPLDSTAVNNALDQLETFGPEVRTVVAP
jgi:threonine dehydrogenase-like Zn-dependent dehydrogenase